jgi:pimeloyl-ACP methyl ester carboxylesterase
MPYAEVNDIRMYYEEMGSGVPLVLMHGASSAIDDPVYSWADLMLSFAERYRTIHLEHRGHGRTDNPAGKLTYTMIADDVCAFIERMGLAPAHVAGVSDGGIVALTIGMTRPELARCLVAVGPNYYNDEQVVEANQFADLERMERETPEQMAVMAARHDRNKAPGWWRELFRQLAANLAVNPAYTEADLRRIPNPTLLIAGEDDLWGNLNQMFAMRRAIPHSELLIVNHAPHEVQHTHPWIVGPQVLDFLERRSG